MKKILIFLIPLMVTLFVGCKGVGIKGNGNVVNEKRAIDKFDEISISGAYNVDIYVGEEPSVEISGEENLLQYISTEVEHGELNIYNERSISPRKRIVIKVYTPGLNSISTSGASNIYAESIYSERFVMDLSGAGSIKLNGDTQSFEANLSGAGSLEAKDLIAKYVDINISGASSADVYASEKLDASVSGVGGVNYYGNPKNVDTDISGVGNIRRKSE